MSKVVPKPIEPIDLLNTVIRPTLKMLTAYGIPVSQAAERFLVATCGQETGFKWTRQVLSDGTGGPATGRWQFESGGGVKGVMTHNASEHIARKVVSSFALPWDRQTIWAELEHNDNLACAFARLLMWTDPFNVPTDQNAAWVCYADRLWRPGKPHPETWGKYWAIGSQVVLLPPEPEKPEPAGIAELVKELRDLHTEMGKRIQSLEQFR